MELLDLALTMSSPPERPGTLKRTMSTATALSVNMNHCDASLALEQLHGTPSEYDEDSPDFVADDVNALGLSSSRQSSYVGSSSIATALKVIAVICPDIMKHSSLTAPNSPFGKSERSVNLQNSTTPSRETEVLYVDAYFDHFHHIIPMINEHQFRHKFESGSDDLAWLALMNMVLAMGSIAKETCLESTHAIFYQRAKNFLSFDSFGSGKLEIVQALALMGGLYLHYCNRPNMAVAVTGAALRMAYALGLHRKQPSELTNSQTSNQSPTGDKENKRRTWWVLVCLDTWGSTTLGRPSMGDCFGPAISIPPPSFDDFPNHALEAKAPILVAAVQFCELSAQIQDRLASAPCLNLADATAYDSQLENQYVQLPPMLLSPNQCPANLHVPRAIIKWQNQNLRLLLHRPTLLAAALARKPFEELALAEQESIARCRDIAGETIVDIACDWQPDPVCGWHAAWYLFQAAMVPLVSVFYEHNNSRACGKWHGQIDMALRLLHQMELWSPIAKKTRQVIAELQHSSTQVPDEVLAGNTQILDQQSPFLFDEAWANSMWFNASDWPTYPLDPTEYANGVHQDTSEFNDSVQQAHVYMNGVQQHQQHEYTNGMQQDEFVSSIPSLGHHTQNMRGG